MASDCSSRGVKASSFPGGLVSLDTILAQQRPLNVCISPSLIVPLHTPPPDIYGLEKTTSLRGKINE